MLKKLCLFGDSVAEGIIFDSVKKKYIRSENSFFKKFCDQNNYDLSDFSRFGCTLLKGRELIFKSLALIKECDGVILMFGGNDCNFNWKEVAQMPDLDHKSFCLPEDFVREYVKTIKAIRDAGGKVILVNMIPVVGRVYFNWISRLYGEEGIKKFLLGPETIEHYNEMYNCLIYKIAKECDVPLIDVRSALLLKKNLADYYSTDGIHPNAQGYQLLFETACSQIEVALRENKKTA